MSKHTPGPWDIKININSGDKESQMFSFVGESELCEPICIIPHDDITWDGEVEMRANARLIAASPNLLDALKQWQWAEVNGDMDELDNARVSRDLAIAKATGDA